MGRAGVFICDRFCVETAKPAHRLLEAKRVSRLWKTDQRMVFSDSRRKWAILGCVGALWMSSVFWELAVVGDQLFAFPDFTKSGEGFFVTHEFF